MPDALFVYTGPTDTDKELARYRDALLNFMMNAVSPQELEDCNIVLSARHVFRFMRQTQKAEQVSRELAAGLHPQMEALIESQAQLRALVEVLLRAKTAEQTEKATASLANYMDQLTLNGE